jgi:acetyltransferase-like isoleucine patch superfamily enzyme
MSQDIHKTAMIDSDVLLPRNIRIGPYSIVHRNTTFGEDVSIGAFCEIGLNFNEAGQDLYIGPESLVRSHTVIYSGSVFKSRLETGHHVSLRENIVAGENLRVGTYSDIQGDVNIGNFVRLHSNVHLAKGTTIGNCVWIFPFVVTTNDPFPPSNMHQGVNIGDFAVISTASVILPGVVVSEGSIVGAKSVVTRNVEPNTLVVGSPAKFVKLASEIRLQNGEYAYPWTEHFDEKYIDEIRNLINAKKL